MLTVKLRHDTKTKKWRSLAMAANAYAVVAFDWKSLILDLSSTASVVVRNDGDSAVSEIQLAADALNANRLVYLNAKADNKRLAISKDYKVTLDKVDFNPAI